MTYDQLQAHLGGVGSEFASNVSQITYGSNASEETVQLILDLARMIQKSLDDLALCISQAMQLE